MRANYLPALPSLLNFLYAPTRTIVVRLPVGRPTPASATEVA
ncbi:MAG TPA: hypothetical protein VK052_06515 [Zeimonas sp.]|nr:hypothetical protein [Zeimonas sp.]